MVVAVGDDREGEGKSHSSVDDGVVPPRVVQGEAEITYKHKDARTQTQTHTVMITFLIKQVSRLFSSNFTLVCYKSY